MAIRDMHDKIRVKIMTNSDMFPTRTIVYKPYGLSDISLQSTIGSGTFNKIEKEKLAEMQSFGSLILSQKPTNKDTVTYDDTTFIVQRTEKLGQLYVVYCEKTQHRGRPKR